MKLVPSCPDLSGNNRDSFQPLTSSDQRGLFILWIRKQFVVLDVKKSMNEFAPKRAAFVNIEAKEIFEPELTNS